MKFLKYIIPAFFCIFSACAEDDALVHGVGEEDIRKEGPNKLLVYVNFDGGKLFIGDCGYPQKDITCMSHTEGVFPPHDSDDEYRSDVINLLRAVWSDYDVAFTTLRPNPEYHYTMIVVSPQQSLNEYRLSKDKNAVGGVAPGDCFNRRLSDTAHVFSKEKNRNVLDMTEVISHETGHTIGLTHVLDKESIMYSPGTNKIREWKDECVELTDSQCPPISDSCAEGFTNHHEEMLLIIGPAK